MLKVVNLPGLLFAAFAPHLVNTFTCRVGVRLSVSVRIMVNCNDRVRFREYMSVNSPKLFCRHFSIFVKYYFINACSVERYWHCSDETVHYKYKTR